MTPLPIQAPTQRQIQSQTPTVITATKMSPPVDAASSTPPDPVTLTAVPTSAVLDGRNADFDTSITDVSSTNLFVCNPTFVKLYLMYPALQNYNSKVIYFCCVCVGQMKPYTVDSCVF